VIQATAVSVGYNGHPVVDRVTLGVAAGEWVGLIGPNGAGKSSLLRAVSGAVAFTGEVTIDGTPLHELGRRQAARAIAVVPQNPLLPEDMAVIDYVLLGRTPHLGYLAAESDHDVAITEAALWDLGIIHLAERPMGSLSGGERQRCVLARALTQEAPILLLDEPTSALDIGHRQQVLDLVADLRRTRGIAILAAMHDLTLAGQYADRLAFMQNGRIIVDGPPEDVLTEQVISGFAGARVTVMRGPDGEVVVVPRRR
jgi:iron complex transport system ATP-binding protein